MAEQNRNSNFLLWGLVGGCFFLIILFWIPSFLVSINSIQQNISSERSGSASFWKKEWDKSQLFVKEVKGSAVSSQTNGKNPENAKSVNVDTVQQEKNQQQDTPSSPVSFPSLEKTKQEEKKDTFVEYCLEKGGVVRREKQKKTNSELSFCELTGKDPCELKAFFDGTCGSK